MRSEKSIKYRQKVNLVRCKERHRINSLIDRDGLSKAVFFAEKTMIQYLTCLAYKNKTKIGPKYHYSRNSEYRHEFVGSILELKLFLKEVT